MMSKLSYDRRALGISYFIVTVALCRFLITGTAAPDPYATRDEPWIGPSDTPTMEQVFWVQVPAPPGETIEVILPDGVELVDRTKPGDGRERTRFYLRAERAIQGKSIILDWPGVDSRELKLTVRSYREDIEHHIQQVPGIDPNVRKRGRSYYTSEMIELANRNIDAYPELAEDLRRETQYDGLDNDELFASLPSWNVPRAKYSNWPCPYCGEAIFEHSGFYPWVLSPDKPFQAQCPDCERVFPSNNWTDDDFTSGDYPDDGWGWDPGTGERSDYAGWVAYYNHMQHWKSLGKHLRTMSLRHLLLDDDEAAHRVAVLLARLAYVYPGMNMRWQQVDDRRLRHGRILLDGNWERNEILVPAAKAYDAIFDALDDNRELVEFLNEKDSSIETPDDVKALIETYFIQVLGWDWIRREGSGGNMGARELNMIQYSILADMDEMSDRWLEEVFTRAYNSGLNKGGFDDAVITNQRTREGPTWVGGFYYAFGYTQRLAQIARELAKIDDRRWRDRTNLYDRRVYPKVHAELHTWLDLLVAGQFVPLWGDGGNPRGLTYSEGVAGGESLREPYQQAYQHWGNDRFARALHRLGPGEPQLFRHDMWDEVEAHVERVGQESSRESRESRVLDGFGVALLEANSGADDLSERAGVALRYGYTRGHHHEDNLDVQFFANGKSLTPELGYPSWAHPMGATHHVAHHNTGMIDWSPQYDGFTARGTLEMFAPAPEASFVDVSAEPAGFPNRTYRRAIALADAPNGNVYLFDILRLAGGTTRTFTMHGPPYREYSTNLRFSSTGEDALGVGPLGRDYESNFLDPKEAREEEDVWMEWTHETDSLKFRLHLLGEPGRSYLTSRFGKTDSPPIRFLFAEDDAHDGASEFVSLWQSYKDEPFIDRVERLDIQGYDPDREYTPVAVRVHLKGGQVDTFIYSFDPDVDLLVDGNMEFRGSFGYWSKREGETDVLHLVNGGYLRHNHDGIMDAIAPYAGRVEWVDYDQRRVGLNEPLPRDIAYVGKMMFVHNDQRRNAYEIAAVDEDRMGVELRHNPILYRSKLMMIDEDEAAVTAEVAPPIEVSSNFPPGYYDGATLTNDQGEGRFKVEHIDEAVIDLDGPATYEDFPESRDGRRMLRIYDFGPMDDVTIYQNVFKGTAPPP